MKHGQSQSIGCSGFAFNTLSGSYRDEAVASRVGVLWRVVSFNTLSGSYRDEACLAGDRVDERADLFQYPQRVVPG